MDEIVNQIEDVIKNGTINIYGVLYQHRNKNENFAIALPKIGETNLIENFCSNIIRCKDLQEVSYDPLSNGSANGTYETIKLSNIKTKWDEICNLINDHLDFSGKVNREKVSFSNLFIGALDYDEKRYYLFAKQHNNSNKLLTGKSVILANQDKVKLVKDKEIFVIDSYVSLIVDKEEDKVLIFDKKDFQDIFKYNDYLKETVNKNLNILDQWNFLSSSQFIKDKASQKNVYERLAVVFENRTYIDQINNTKPADLKANIIKYCPNEFSEADFIEDKLNVTSNNLDKVMKMLSKGFKFNFFTNEAER